MEGEQSLAEKLMGVTNPAGSGNGFGDIGECILQMRVHLKDLFHIGKGSTDLTSL